MQIRAEVVFNPRKSHISKEGKKRLKWMYIIHYECGGQITKAARKIGISRTWLSSIHAKWERSGRNPCSLEPESRAPRRVSVRSRISKETENKIVELRKEYAPWGKDKLSTILTRDYEMKACPTTVNRYLHHHGLINLKLSQKNKRAWERKKSMSFVEQKIRPPKEIKDYKPGALIEKDMKFILKRGKMRNTAKQGSKENFYYQHTMIDSFTRIRVLELVEEPDSKSAGKAYERAVMRMG